jgi:hypothetical protein
LKQVVLPAELKQNLTRDHYLCIMNPASARTIVTLLSFDKKWEIATGYLNIHFTVV